MVAVGVGGHAFRTRVVIAACGVTPRTWRVGRARAKVVDVHRQLVRGAGETASARVRDRLRRGAARDDEDRAVGEMQQPLRDAPEQHPCEPAVPARASDDHVCFPLGRDVGDDVAAPADHRGAELQLGVDSCLA